MGRLIGTRTCWLPVRLTCTTPVARYTSPTLVFCPRAPTAARGCRGWHACSCAAWRYWSPISPDGVLAAIECALTASGVRSGRKPGDFSAQDAQTTWLCPGEDGLAGHGRPGRRRILPRHDAVDSRRQVQAVGEQLEHLRDDRPRTDASGDELHSAGVHRQQGHFNLVLGVDPRVGAHAVRP